MLGCLGALEKRVGVVKVNFFDLASCMVYASAIVVYFL